MNVIETRIVGSDSWHDFDTVMQEAAKQSKSCQNCYCFKHRVEEVPEDSKSKMRALIRSGKAQGLLSYKEHKVTGWVAFEKVEDLPGLEVDLDARNLLIHCYQVVDPEESKEVLRILLQGVARRAAYLEYDQLYLHVKDGDESLLAVAKKLGYREEKGQEILVCALS